MILIGLCCRSRGRAVGLNLLLGGLVSLGNIRLVRGQQSVEDLLLAELQTSRGNSSVVYASSKHSQSLTY